MDKKSVEEPYVSYEHWFDNGPGSEAFKRRALRTEVPEFPFFSNPSTTPEEVCVSCKKKPTVQIMLTNSEGQSLLVADIDPNVNYWEVDVPKRKKLTRLIKKLLK